MVPTFPRMIVVPQADAEPLEAAMQPHAALSLGARGIVCLLVDSMEGRGYMCVCIVCTGAVFGFLMR